jgi:hypothetical protein
MNSSVAWGTVADWFVVLGTLILAAVALFQDTIRGWFYRPKFRVSCKCEPPDCIAIPITSQFVTDSIFLRILVENIGNATAQTAEVYAKELRLLRLDGNWEIVSSFPHMNLKWANLGQMYTRIVPGMAKHCDVGHIIDPSKRQDFNENAPQLRLTSAITSLAFELIVRPNNMSHIVGPGDYELDIQVAAENVRPITRTLQISLKGTWDADEETMLRNGVGITVKR